MSNLGQCIFLLLLCLFVLVLTNLSKHLIHEEKKTTTKKQKTKKTKNKTNHKQTNKQTNTHQIKNKKHIKNEPK